MASAHVVVRTLSLIREVLADHILFGTPEITHEYVLRAARLQIAVEELDKVAAELGLDFGDPVAAFGRVSRALEAYVSVYGTGAHGGGGPNQYQAIGRTGRGCGIKRTELIKRGLASYTSADAEIDVLFPLVTQSAVDFGAQLEAAGYLIDDLSVEAIARTYQEVLPSLRLNARISAIGSSQLESFVCDNPTVQQPASAAEILKLFDESLSLAELEEKLASSLAGEGVIRDMLPAGERETDDVTPAQERGAGDVRPVGEHEVESAHSAADSVADRAHPAGQDDARGPYAAEANEEYTAAGRDADVESHDMEAEEPRPSSEREARADEERAAAGRDADEREKIPASPPSVSSTPSRATPPAASPAVSRSREFNGRIWYGTRPGLRFNSAWCLSHVCRDTWDPAVPITEETLRHLVYDLVGRNYVRHIKFVAPSLEGPPRKARFAAVQIVFVHNHAFKDFIHEYEAGWTGSLTAWQEHNDYWVDKRRREGWWHWQN
ncbi:hypothetical protein JCM3770_001210 [Rhodotorula araucariae]